MADVPARIGNYIAKVPGKGGEALQKYVKGLSAKSVRASARAAKQPLLFGSAAFAAGGLDRVARQMKIPRLEITPNVSAPPSAVMGAVIVGAAIYTGDSDVATIGAGMMAPFLYNLGETAADAVITAADKAIDARKAA